MGSFQGELAALVAAALWAIASVIYGQVGQRIQPLLLNLLKGMIAIVLLLLTLGLLGEFKFQIASLPLLLLLGSGLVGIGLGDTFHFQAINYLGARRALLLESLAPPLTTLISWVALQETLTPRAWVGIGLTIAGVSWVISERVPPSKISFSQEKLLWPGVGFGILAAIFQSSGVVLSRAALAESTISPLWSALLRLLSGTLPLALWLAVRRQTPLPHSWRLERKSWRLVAAVAFAAFTGTYLGIWLQQIALKYAPAAIAQSLCSTSPLFVLPIAMALGDRVSPRAFLGVLIALAGVAFLLGN